MNGTINAASTVDVAADGHSWNPVLPNGGAPAIGAPEGPGFEILINADVEPDADGDGYGDETQDLCPSDASTQGACPAPPPAGGGGSGTPAPTPAQSKCKKKSKKKSAAAAKKKGCKKKRKKK